MPATYDIVLSSPFHNYDYFAHRMRELCGQMGLTFFMVDDVWVHEFLQKLRNRDIGVKVPYDLTANQSIEDDPLLISGQRGKAAGRPHDR